MDSSAALLQQQQQHNFDVQVSATQPLDILIEEWFDLYTS